MGKGRGKNKTIEQFKKEVFDLVGDEYAVLGEYINTNINILMRHNICGHEWGIRPSNFLHGNRCPKCYGNIKYTYEEIKVIIKNFGYELISKKYKRNSEKLIIKDKDGYYYMISLTNLKSGQKPVIAHKSNQYSIQNIKLWCKLKNKPFILLSDKYINAKKKLKWKCLKEECGEEFEMNWNEIFSLNYGCNYCSSHKVSIKNCLATKFPEIAKEWHPILNGNLTPYDVMPNSHKHVWWQCSENSKHEWYAIISNRISKNYGCPECNKSKGEKRIDEILVNNNWIKISQEEFEQLSDIDKNINTYFIPQMKYEELIGLGNGLLSYDFYIPKLNLLIEYDGEFHYKPIKNYKNESIEFAKKRFEKQKIHDKLKDEYAKNNNITLLRIPYWEFDNIEEILNNYL